MKDKDFEKLLASVPIDYYQNGINTNILQKYWHKTKINCALKILNKIAFKNCLEVGSASGYMISEIEKKYPQAKFYAIDAYIDAIKYAKKHYPRINFVKGKAEKLPYKNNEFDLVLCYETIEHIQNPQKGMNEMKRVLKKGGKAILAMDSGTLAFRIIWFFWEKTFGRAWAGAHINPYHYKDLEKLAIKPGFKILERQFTHFGLEVVLVLEK